VQCFQTFFLRGRDKHSGKIAWPTTLLAQAVFHTHKNVHTILKQRVYSCM